MPVDIDGTLWYPHGRKVVEAPDGTNEASKTLIVSDIATGDVLSTRSVEAPYSVVPLTTNTRGETPPAWLAPQVQVYVRVEGGQTYPSETIELGAISDKAENAETNSATAASAASAAAAAAVEAAKHPDYTRRYDGADYVWWNGEGFVAGRPDLDPPYVVHAESTAYPDAPAPTGMVDGDTWTRVVPGSAP